MIVRVLLAVVIAAVVGVGAGACGGDDESDAVAPAATGPGGQPAQPAAPTGRASQRCLQVPSALVRRISTALRRADDGASVRDAWAVEASGGGYYVAAEVVSEDESAEPPVAVWAVDEIAPRATVTAADERARELSRWPAVDAEVDEVAAEQARRCARG